MAVFDGKQEYRDFLRPLPGVEPRFVQTENALVIDLEDGEAAGGGFLPVRDGEITALAAQSPTENDGDVLCAFSLKSSDFIQLWVRMKGRAETPCTFALDGCAYKSPRNIGENANEYGWARVMMACVGAGNHVLRVKSGSEGEYLDRILIANRSFSPKGRDDLPGAAANRIRVRSYPIEAYIGGSKLMFETPPYFDERGVLYIPIRDVFEQLGGFARFDGKSAEIAVAGHVVGIKAQSPAVCVDGENFRMKAMTIQKNGLFFAPISMLEFIDGVDFAWSDDDYAFSLSVSEKPAEEGLEVCALPGFQTAKITVKRAGENADVQLWTRRENDSRWVRAHEGVPCEEGRRFYLRNLHENSNYVIKCGVYSEMKEIISGRAIFRTKFIDEFDFVEDAVPDTSGGLVLRPTYENIGVYYPGEAGEALEVTFREKGGSWRSALTPVYDDSAKQVRGSIVKLREDTVYEIKAVCGGNVYDGEARTWSSNPPIAKELRLEDFYCGGPLLLQNVHGSPDGWIRISGNIPVTGNAYDYEAVQIADSSYVILDGLAITGGRRHGIAVNNGSHDIRISNCDISGWGRIGAFHLGSAERKDFDGSPVNNDAAVAIEEVGNITVERCYLHDPNGTANAWDGELWKVKHPVGPNGVYVRAFGSCIIRYNDIIGSDSHRWNDSIESYQNRSRRGGPAVDCDIYGNMLAYGQDDSTEFDGGQMNARFYHNRLEGFLCGISTAPNRVGPSYIYNNLMINLGDSYGKIGSAIKNGGGDTYSQGVTHLLHNTIVVAGHGMKSVGYGSDDNRGMYRGITRNNIILTEKAGQMPICDDYFMEHNSFDYDFTTCRGDNSPGNKMREDQEPHGKTGNPLFAGEKTADYRLRPESPAVGSGIRLPNFSSESGSVDMGAFGGEVQSLPHRPLDVKADRMFVAFTSQESDFVTITAGEKSPGKFKLLLNSAIDWLDFTAEDGKTCGELAAGQSIMIRFAPKYGNIRHSFAKTIALVRFENGLSVPVTVHVLTEV